LGSHILETIDEDNLELCIRAIHENWISLLIIFGGTSQWEMNQSNDFITISSGLKIPDWNSVMRTRLSSSNVDKKIEETIDYFSSLNIPFSWRVYPGHTPEDLAQHLEDHGLSRKTGRGMAVIIDNLKIPEKPQEFTVQKVSTAELLETYAKLMPRGYEMPEWGHKACTQALIDMGLRDDLHHYVGFIDDVPVATSTVLYADGVVGIHNVSTLPSARRKGIGSYMTVVPLLEARERGYKVSTLLSSKMGENVYRKLGYVKYCQPVRYQWDPPS
jgi:GNAT superfamily N-acetyltransferase